MSEAETVIRNGSHTFALAGKFFPKDEWTAACQIYHWCRYCDDVTDNGDRDVQSLKHETNKVLVAKQRSILPAFNSLQEVFQKYQIPKIYADEMLNGMEMDLHHTPYKTLKDLELYCYRVASVVGLMMCYIMGIFDERALKHAADLGMAMQFTNISRDVKEDFENNRNYFPLEWNDKTQFEKVELLLARAHDLYESGFKGLKYLPLRSAFVILIAALFYREIGREILLTGPSALKKRVVVSTPRKLMLLIEAVFMMVTLMPERLKIKNKKIIIQSIWRPV